MTLPELKSEIRKYQYLEDEGMIDVALAAVIATRLKLGDPIWMTIIGPSSSGKSQILRPIAQTDPKFMHRIDDLTENTFLSGANNGDKELSLLSRIGPLGMLVLSDLTVLFSKNAEARATILSQFRMLYDGEMVKYSGNKDQAIRWKGSLGVLSGSTPSIYDHFAEVADMGERFIYYRMKDYDDSHAARIALRRSKTSDGHKTDALLAAAYEEYLRVTVSSNRDIKDSISIPEWIEDRIISISHFAERMRTSTRMDFKESHINKIPVPAMRTRVALQLYALAHGLWVMRDGVLTEKDAELLEWCGWSLANEERRRVMAALATYPYGPGIRTQMIADKIGLATDPVNKALQSLAAIGLVKRDGDDNGLFWSIKEEDDWKTTRRICGITGEDRRMGRAISAEEVDEAEEAANFEFESLGHQVG